MRRCPSATDPGTRDGPFPQARKATPAAHQGANLMEEAEHPKENVDPKLVSWLKFEPHLLPQLRKERGAVPSRGDEDLRCIGARARGGNFSQVVCPGVVDPELANYAVQVFEVCHVEPFHLPSSTCDCDGGSDLVLQTNKSVEQEMTSPLRLLQVVENATCLLGFSLKCGSERSVIPARFLLMSSPFFSCCG